MPKKVYAEPTSIFNNEDGSVEVDAHPDGTLCIFATDDPLFTEIEAPRSLSVVESHALVAALVRWRYGSDRPHFTVNRDKLREKATIESSFVGPREIELRRWQATATFFGFVVMCGAADKEIAEQAAFESLAHAIEGVAEHISEVIQW